MSAAREAIQLETTRLPRQNNRKSKKRKGLRSGPRKVLVDKRTKALTTKATDDLKKTAKTGLDAELCLSGGQGGKGFP